MRLQRHRSLRLEVLEALIIAVGLGLLVAGTGKAGGASVETVVDRTCAAVVSGPDVTPPIDTGPCDPVDNLSAQAEDTGVPGDIPHLHQGAGDTAGTGRTGTRGDTITGARLNH